MFVPIWVMVLAFLVVCADNFMRASRHRRELEDVEARLNKLHWKYKSELEACRAQLEYLHERRDCCDDY